MGLGFLVLVRVLHLPPDVLASSRDIFVVNMFPCTMNDMNIKL